MHKHFKASITTVAKKVANSNFQDTFRVVFKVFFSKLSGHFKQFYDLFKFTSNEIGFGLEQGYNDGFKTIVRRLHLEQKSF